MLLDHSVKNMNIVKILIITYISILTVKMNFLLKCRHTLFVRQILQIK